MTSEQFDQIKIVRQFILEASDGLRQDALAALDLISQALSAGITITEKAALHREVERLNRELAQLKADRLLSERYLEAKAEDAQRAMSGHAEEIEILQAALGRAQRDAEADNAQRMAEIRGLGDTIAGLQVELAETHNRQVAASNRADDNERDRDAARRVLETTNAQLARLNETKSKAAGLVYESYTMETDEKRLAGEIEALRERQRKITYELTALLHR